MACKWRLDMGQIEVIDDATAEVLRTKTPAQRIDMVFRANYGMRLLIRTGIERLHPDWEDATIDSELARVMLNWED
jgi:hypothetical protein